MKKALATFALVTLTATIVRADVELGWDVAGHGSPADTSLTASTIGPDISGMPALTRTGLTANGAGNSFNSTNWNVSGTFDETNQYIGFTLTAANPISLTDLNYAVNGSNTAPNMGEWGYRVNGSGSFTLQGTFALANAAPTTLSTWDFADVHLNSGDSVEFRFWAFGTTAINSTAAAATSGTVRIANLPTAGNDDLVLNGNPAAAIPEPTTIGLLGLGLIGTWAVGYRRSRK
ncbi:MAG TPA: PEP-CTERM sorting domain-containing protein [Chthoniobacterales bacterium]|jgi:hypothetical protein